jgi:hypothetical protein
MRVLRCQPVDRQVHGSPRGPAQVRGERAVRDRRSGLVAAAVHVQHLVRPGGPAGHHPFGGYPAERAAAVPGAAREGHDTTGDVQQRAPQGERESRGEQWTHDGAGELPDDGTGQPHTGR